MCRSSYLIVPETFLLIFLFLLIFQNQSSAGNVIPLIKKRMNNNKITGCFFFLFWCFQEITGDMIFKPLSSVLRPVLILPYQICTFKLMCTHKNIWVYTFINFTNI